MTNVNAELWHRDYDHAAPEEPDMSDADEDRRFTAGLIADVRNVLVRHGYRLPTDDTRYAVLGGFVADLMRLTEAFEGKARESSAGGSQ